MTMQVTDQMIYAFALEYYGDRPTARDPQLLWAIRNALTAASPPPPTDTARGSRPRGRWRRPGSPGNAAGPMLHAATTSAP